MVVQLGRRRGGDEGESFPFCLADIVCGQRKPVEMRLDLMVSGKGQDRVLPPERIRYRFGLWIASTMAVLVTLIFLGAGLQWLAMEIRKAREQARRTPFVSCIGVNGGYEIMASGSPEAEVERLLRARLEFLASTRSEKPTGLRIHVRRIDGDDLRPLRRFHKAVSLHLEAATLEDGAIEVLNSLPNLNRLSLTSTGISDEDANRLCKLVALEHLDIRDTHISSETLQRLRSALPRCTITIE